MSETWKNWEGQVVDHKYQLRQFLASTEHSVVFLAERHNPNAQPCALKFVAADFPGKEQQLALWGEVARLSHPNLLEIYGAGLWKMEDMETLYVAMEYAEENLGQVLPHRELTAEETGEMLNAIVDVLVYLHGRNLVHGHVKPSNVLAMGELLKLSSDTIVPAGEVHEMRRQPSAYDAPELPDAPHTPAADMWSLGVTLVEAATQQQAILPFNENADPIIPEQLREPFLDIARNTLRRAPKLRWSSARIAEQLNPAAFATRAVAVGAAGVATVPVASAATATATASVPPAPPVPAAVNLPLSQEPVVPLAKTALARPASSAVKPKLSQQQRVQPKQTVSLPSYVIPVFAGVLLLIALIVLPFALRHRGKTETGPTVATAEPPASEALAAGSAANPSAQTPAPRHEISAPAPEAAAQAPAPVQSETAAAAPATAAPKVNKEPAPRQVSATSGADGKGEVLDQVRPQAPAKALATISGTVRVSVKAHVDAAGKVTEATLQDPGPSHYFSDLSLKAARQWVFTPPEADGRSVPSDWLIRFHYTKAGVEMLPQQLAP